MNKNIVEHEAIIRKNENGKIIADILTKSACASCQLKGICSVSDVEKKEVAISSSNSTKYNVGDKVIVYLPEKKALQAVLWGYVFPLFIVVVILFILIGITSKEGLSALISLGTLIPYYILLYIFKNKLGKNYIFKIKE